MLRPSSSLQSCAFDEWAPIDRPPGRLGAGVILRAVFPGSAATLAGHAGRHYVLLVNPPPVQAPGVTFGSG